MSELSDILTKDGTREPVVSDLAESTENSINNLSGLSGKAIKTAFSGAVKARPNLVKDMTDRLLPHLADRLNPYWQAYQNGKPEGGFGKYLETRSDEVTKDLADLSDERMESIINSGAQKIYKTFRGKLEGIVEKGLPDLGDVIEKHAS